MGELAEPVHPGETLTAEFLTPLGLTGNQLAASIHVPVRRIDEIVDGSRGICADTALRLARFFGTSAQFWVNLQARYDLERGRDELERELAEIRPLDETRPADG